MPQRPEIVSDWKKQIDETVWMDTVVRRSLSSSGDISQLTLKTQQSDSVDGGNKATEN